MARDSLSYSNLIFSASARDFSGSVLVGSSARSASASAAWAAFAAACSVWVRSFAISSTLASATPPLCRRGRGGRDQTNLVTQIADGAPPVMRAPTSFHGDNATRLLGKESEDFLSRKLLAERHTAVSAGAVRLKRPLCKVETDDVNLFHGCPLRSWDAQTSPPLAHRDAVRRGHPLHQPLSRRHRGHYNIDSTSVRAHVSAAGGKGGSTSSWPFAGRVHQ